MNVYEKGRKGEEELCQFLSDYGISARRNCQHIRKGGRCNPDVTAGGALSQLHVETKAVEKLNVYRAYRQAHRDADGSGLYPCVVHRRSCEQWMVTLSLNDLIKILNNTEVNPNDVQ